MTSRLWTLACGLAAAVLLVVPAQAETLSDVVAYAYETNPGIQAQRAALRALDEGYVQARGAYGLSVTASAGDMSYELRRAGGKADAITDNIGVSIVQPLYTGGRARGRITEAEARIQTGREQLRRAELDLLTRVVTAYMSVRRDEQLEVIAKDTVAVLEKELHDTEAKFKVHVITMTDVQQSKARLAQGRTQLVGIQEQLAGSRAQFFGVVSRNPGTLEPAPPLEKLPNTIDEAETAAEANSPLLRAAVYSEVTSRARVQQARAAGLPSISARVDIQRAPFAPYQSLPYDNSRAASVVINQPLFASGQIRSGIRQAVEENNRDLLSIDDTRLQLLQSVTVDWEHLVSLRKQLATLEEEVRTNELAFYGVRAEERLALRSNIEVLNAEAELSAAQQNLTRARAAEYVARVQLLAGIGALTPQVLAPQVTTYDSAKNFRAVKDRGSTPLDWPVRVLDGIAAPGLAPQRPASLAEAHPTGSPKEPTPPAERPITSILQIPDRPLSDKPPS
jgi:S-layer protein transport system outer membrane protein